MGGYTVWGRNILENTGAYRQTDFMIVAIFYFIVLWFQYDAVNISYSRSRYRY